MSATDRPIDALGILMRAAQRGDAAAYTELLKSITPRIRRVVLRERAFAGLAAVDDLVQDVLLSVYAVRATYDSARPFEPWLLAIVRSRLAVAARRYARTGARAISWDHTDHGAVAASDTK